MSKQLAERCDGQRLRRALADAAVWLESQAVEINALNVFPVPDGDTGTNMSLTLQSAVREASSSAEDSLSAVARAAAQGALLGARGNSGVILSQFLRGIARSLEKRGDCDAAELAQALSLGSATAYKAVIRPVEGTILTVGRDAAQAAVASAEAGGDVDAVLEAAVVAARASLARTPSLLPVLRQAGVVDAGGQGLLCILDGLLRSFRGESIARAEADGRGPTAMIVPSTEYGYCTEFLVRAERLDLDALRAHIVTLGDSALVVGEGNVARVHVHTFRPGLVLDYAMSVGTLHKIKIDNMQDQHEHVLLSRAQAEKAALVEADSPHLELSSANGSLQQTDQNGSEQPTIVAVAAGAGFASVLRSLGVSTVVPGGQTMNPSTEEILSAVEAAPSTRVLLLPNNGNILLAAKQVHLLTEKQVAVIPTQDMAQGVAAAVAFVPEADLVANARAMEAAMRAVQTGEVTTAVRAAKIDGFEIRPGQVLGLVGGQLVAVGTEAGEVLEAMLAAMRTEAAQVLTVFYGAEVDADQAQAIATRLGKEFPDQQVELINGGQPLYQYVISVE